MTIFQLAKLLLGPQHGGTGFHELHSRADPILGCYIIGCIVLILTASLCPKLMDFDSRVASFGLSAWGDMHASAGFYLDRDTGRAVCFHCALKMQACHAESACCDPLEQHKLLSPRCFLQKLLHLIKYPGDIRATELSPDSARFRRALGKLGKDLAPSGMLKFVESFGFTWCEIEQAIAKYFMQHGGNVPDKPGDVIEIINSNRVDVHPRLLEMSISHIVHSLSSIEYS